MWLVIRQRDIAEHISRWLVTFKPSISDRAVVFPVVLRAQQQSVSSPTHQTRTGLYLAGMSVMSHQCYSRSRRGETLVIRHNISSSTCLVTTTTTILWVNKNQDSILCPQLRQILTDFRDSFTCGLSTKFAIKLSLNIPSYLKRVAIHYLVKYYCLKIAKIWNIHCD